MSAGIDAPRRRAIAWAAAWLCAPSIAPAIAADPEATRERWLHDGEAALARGDVTTANASFERAAAMLHAADTEMALVRTAMQAGAYRQALAFNAHTAGAHRDAPDASALYAWLLQAGGQGAYALRVLEEAESLSPNDAVLQEARRQLQSDVPRTTPLLLKLPHRMAPQAVMQGNQPALDQAATCVGSATLIDAGRHALAPTASIQGAKAIWLRNGLGQTTAAEVERIDDTLGLTLLRLPIALDPGPTPGALDLPPRDPFPGSPGYAVEFHTTSTPDPAWPWLSLGFLGSPKGKQGTRSLGIWLPSNEPRGGPVFDASGRLAGIAITSPDGSDLWLPPSLLSNMPGNTPAATASPRLQPDEIYERSLRFALQLIATR